MNESNITNDMQTLDGRKVISISTNEMSVGIESEEQKHRGRKAEIEAEIEEMKLASMKRGCYSIKPW